MPEKVLSGLSDSRMEEIRYAFFPCMYGIYPYVYPTDKQKLHRLRKAEMLMQREKDCSCREEVFGTIEWE